MNFKKLLTRLSVALLGAFLLAAQAAAAEAKILKIVGTGAATVVFADGHSEAVKQTTVIPAGATIVTGPNIELFVETVTGAVTTIAADSRVLIETLDADNAILDLKAGKVASQIDTNRIAKRNYGVRTPKGVAAARGTSFAVIIKGVQYTVSTSAGTVSILDASGAGIQVVTAGQVSISTVNGGTTTALSALTGDAIKEATDAAGIALAAVAVVASDTTTFGASAAGSAATELKAAMAVVVSQLPADSIAQVVSKAAAGAPGQAGAIVSAAVEAAAANPATLGDMVKVITESAAQGAASSTTDPSQVKNIAADVAKAAVDAAPATQKDAVARIAAENAANGATQGAIQRQGSATATEIAANAAEGAAKGASQGASRAIAGELALLATQGALQGATDVRVQVNNQFVMGRATEGAKEGSGDTTLQTAQAPAQPVVEQPTVTPPSTVNPDLVSPSQTP